MSGAIKIRPMVEGDWPLIASAWTKAAKASHPWCPSAPFGEGHRSAMRKAIHWGSVIYVACLTGCEDRIAAWCCGDPCNHLRGKPLPLLHWIHVRSEYRGMGLSHRLLMELAGDAGHKLTATGWSRAGSRLYKASELINNYRPDLWGRKVR